MSANRTMRVVEKFKGTKDISTEQVHGSGPNGDYHVTKITKKTHRYVINDGFAGSFHCLE